MCLAPSLIINPQARYFLSNDPSGSSVYFNGIDYYGNTIFADTIFNQLLRSKDRKQYTALQIYDFYRNSHLHVNGSRYPLFVLCPCGHCIECRDSYRKEVESRAIIEAAHSGTVLFYTLTYDDDHLPTFGLCQEHVVDAFKRLRQYIKRYIDFDFTFTQVYVGEYATDPRYTQRAHYHGLLFIKEFLTPQQILEFEKLFNGTHEIYKTHDLDGFWPYASRFDFQVARNIVALTKYVTKYITKQYILDNDDDFSEFRKRNYGYKNPQFVQLPKRIGLGCRYIHEYADAILNTTDPFLSVRAQDGALYRVRIPAYFIKKLIPSLSWYMPNACYVAHLVNKLINTSIHLHGAHCTLLNGYYSRFEPYRYLAMFTLKRRQFKQLHRHFDLYTAFYLDGDILHAGELHSVIDNYLLQLESCCPRQRDYYDLIIKPKYDYLNLKILPDISTEDLLEQNNIFANNIVNKVKSKLMFSETACIS